MADIKSESLAGFKSVSVAGFILECMAGFVGIRNNIDWELLMRAVRRHTDCAWVLLYIER